MTTARQSGGDRDGRTDGTATMKPQIDVDGGHGQVLNPPTDEEIRQFLEYLNGGVINDRRLEYEEERRRTRQTTDEDEEGDYDDAAEEEDEDDETAENGVQKRNRTASMYFYRHHYLSIIQEEEEGAGGGDHQGATPASSRCGKLVFLRFLPYSAPFLQFLGPGQ